MPKSTTKEATKKSKQFLEFLKENAESVTNLGQAAEKFGITKSYSVIIREMGLVKKNSLTGTYMWLGGKINKNLAEQVKKLVVEYQHATPA